MIPARAQANSLIRDSRSLFHFCAIIVGFDFKDINESQLLLVSSLVNSSEVSTHLSNLNPPQLEAVKHLDGPILILAGAGSGKTRVLTRRVANLVLNHGIEPDRILAVTFTNKATDEMRERLDQLLGDQYRKPWVATFHATCLRILRRHASEIGYGRDFVVYDAQDTKTLIKQLIRKQQIDEKRYSVAMFQKAIDRAKNNYISASDYARNNKDYQGYEASLIADLYSHYQTELMQCNAMDFGDLIFNTLKLFKAKQEILRTYQFELKHVLVDEFQDTNKVQYMLIRYLTAKRRNLLVVGDDDQSIYAFRGASIANILNFEKDYPETKVVKLEQNYRSTSNILDAAHAVIEKNETRKAKKLWTTNKAGERITLHCSGDESDEAAYVANKIKELQSQQVELSHIAIFYRTNAQSRALEEALMSAAIPYRIYGGQKFYERKEIKDILAYLKLMANPSDNQAFLRSINTPPRGIGAQSIKKIITLAQDEAISLFEAAKWRAEDHARIGAFVNLITYFIDQISGIELHELIGLIIDKSGYATRLEDTKDLANQSRIENLKELQAVAMTMSFEGGDTLEVLRQFLDRASLCSGDELPVEEARDRLAEDEDKAPVPVVSLMTLHLAKGLEYPYVFLTGVEEGLLPHYKSSDDPDSVAEERRLCYVGMTRAMRQLYLTRVRHRSMFSAGDGFATSGFYRQPSRFAYDIPASCIEDSKKDFFDDLQSGSDLDEDESWDFEDEDFESSWSARLKQKKKTKKPKRKIFDGMLCVADSLKSDLAKNSLTKDLPLAELSEIKPGIKVIHPSFGEGVVESLSGLDGAPARVKVAVKFENIDKPKKLLFKHARLALGA